jgi:hypothetical protein
MNKALILAKNISILLVLFCVCCTQALPSVKRYCQIQYKTKGEWSKPYLMQVTFITGKELNDATKSYDYDSFSQYTVAFFGKGKAAVIKLKSSLLGVGDTFDGSHFSSMFSFSGVTGTDQSKREWKIEAKKYGKLFEEMSESERNLYKNASFTPDEDKLDTDLTKSGEEESKVVTVALVDYRTDWFIISSPKGLALVELWTGSKPIGGQAFFRDVDKYGFVELTSKITGLKIKVYVDDYMMSADQAAKKLAAKIKR